MQEHTVQSIRREKFIHGTCKARCRRIELDCEHARRCRMHASCSACGDAVASGSSVSETWRNGHSFSGFAQYTIPPARVRFERHDLHRDEISVRVFSESLVPWRVFETVARPAHDGHSTWTKAPTISVGRDQEPAVLVSVESTLARLLLPSRLVDLPVAVLSLLLSGRCEAPFKRQKKNIL